jgi:hypothetical protein
MVMLDDYATKSRARKVDDKGDRRGKATTTSSWTTEQSYAALLLIFFLFVFITCT